MSFAPPPQWKASMASSPHVHTSIDVGCFDTLIDPHHSGSSIIGSSPVVEVSFMIGEDEHERHHSRTETRRRLEQSMTLATLSPDESFLKKDSVISSTSIAVSNNSILMNSLGTSPDSSELDFTGLPYVEAKTPVDAYPHNLLPSPRTRQSRVSSAVRSSSTTRQSHLMDRQRLTQLRNYLIRSSEASPPTGHADDACSSHGQYEESEESSFVGMLPPPDLIRARSGQRYGIEYTGRESSAPTEVSLLSSTRTLPGEMLSVMPMPTPSNIQQHDEPMRTTKTQAIPRESVAVLIDAVRASTLPADEKCRFIFDHFDEKKRGVLSREDVTAFIEATLVANNTHGNSDVRAHEMTAKLLQGKKEMAYHEFRGTFGHAISKASAMKKSVLQGKPPAPGWPVDVQGSSRGDVDQPEGALLTQRQLDDDISFNATAPPVYYRQSSVGSKKQSQVVRNYRKYQAEIHGMVFYSVCLLTAFVVKASLVAHDSAVGNAMKIAKGFSQVILVNALFLLLPLCLNLVTYLRKFSSITFHVPEDRSVDFRKICGGVMVLAALGHSIAWVFIVHYLRSVPDELWAQSAYARLVFLREETPVQLVQRAPMWTGFLMVLIVAAAAPLTHPRVRQGDLNVSWISHVMCVPFLLLLLGHGVAKWVQPPQAFYWVLPPILLYFIEKRYRLFKISGGKTSIQRVHFSHDTIAVFLHKPKHFHFHPGMFLFLNVPSIARFEWHPFTISSAPEDECLCIHIRKTGEWTKALHSILKHTKHANSDVEADQPSSSSYPSVYIDGPIGAPSQDYYRYKSVVFVGGDSGVTPFASILRSIVYQWQAFKCPCCESVTFPREFQIQKIYFYWVTSEQHSLTWFRETMDELSALDTDGRLEIHHYFCPSTKDPTDEVEGQTAIPGRTTKQVTHVGSPDWKQELQRIAQQQRERSAIERQMKLEQLEHQEGDGQLTSRLDLQLERTKLYDRPPVEDVAVFYCGSRSMGSALHDECIKFNQDTSRASSSVAFDFHREAF